MRCRLVMLLALSGCVGTSAVVRDETGKPRALHEKLKAPPAPELSVGNGAWLGVDHPLTFAKELRGRVTLVNFWTSASIYSAHVAQTLRWLEQRFSNQPFSVVGVHAGKFDAERNVDLVRAAVDQLGLQHPVVMDSDYEVWNHYGVQSWPTIALVDSEGYVVAMESGEPDPHLLEFAINNLLENGRERGTLSTAAASWQVPTALSTTASSLRFPGKVVALSNQRVAVADSGHHRVLIVTLTGQVEAVIGTGLEGNLDGDTQTAAFRNPQGLAAKGSVLFVADAGNHTIRRVDLSTHQVTTIAGTGEIGRGVRATRGPGVTVALRSPWDLALSPTGDALLIAMAGSHQLMTLSLDTLELRPLAGSGTPDLVDGAAEKAAFAQPSGLATDGDRVWVVDAASSALRAVTYSSSEVSTVIGTGLADFGDVDGPVKAARLQHPTGLAVQGDGVLIADSFNGKLKRVSKEGLVTTVGSGFAQPGGITVVGTKVLVADTGHHRLAWADGTEFKLTDVPAAEVGPARTPVKLVPAKVRPNGSVTLVIAAPKKEHFEASTPSFWSANSGAVEVHDGEVRVTLPCPPSVNELHLEADVFTCGEHAACRLWRVNWLIPLQFQADTKNPQVIKAPLR